MLHPATITAIAPPTVQVKLLDTMRVYKLTRPTVSSLLGGLHWQPAVGDRVVVAEWPNGSLFVLCGLSAWGPTSQALLPALLSGEVALYGPTGQVLKYASSGSVTLESGTTLTLGKVGGGAGAGVARLGDQVQVVVPSPTYDASPVTVTGSITTASVNTSSN